jgi:uncharacterized protein (DUF362 family)
MKRRHFLKSTLGAVGALATIRCSGKIPALQASGVTLARDSKCIQKGNLDSERLSLLLDRLFREHFNVADPSEVFRRLFSPQDRVGIKVNCLSGRRMSTHVELVNNVVERLIQVGVPAENILIWDRLNADLRGAGFTLRKWGEPVACAGCDQLGYDSELTAHRSIGSLFARAATEFCTAQINLPVLKDHGIVGVTLGMKNFFGAIHNPNKYHPNHGDPYVADLYSHPAVGGKVRLTIVDALEVQPEGGPPYQPAWCRDWGGLLISTDPVALDRIGWKIIEDFRFTDGLPTLTEADRAPTYIHTAAQLGLGSDDLATIPFKEVG